METTERIFSIADEADFEALALETFRFQAERCAPYREYLDLLETDPDEVRSTAEIPRLPIEW